VLPATRWFDPGELGRALLLAHLILSPLLFSRDTVEAFEQPKVAVTVFTSLVLAALGITAWLGSSGEMSWAERFRRVVSSLRDPLVVGVLLFLLSAAASTVCSISPRLSFRGTPASEFGLVTVGAYTILFFATRWLCRDEADCRRLLAATIVTAAVTSTHAAAQVAFCDPIPWDEVSRLDHYIRPFATMGHPNFLAGYLVMVLPIVILLADQAMFERRWWRLALLVAITGGVILAVVAACSRGAWLALAGTLLVGAAGWTILKRGKRVGIVILAVIPLVVAGVAVVCACTPGGGAILWGLTKRAYLFTYADSRREIWGSAWSLFRDHPWLGCGLDTFHLAFAQKRTVGYWMREWNATPSRAHNEALQILATQGILGIGAAFVVLVSLGMTIARAWRDRGREQRLLLVAIVAGLTGYLVQASFSFTVAGQGTLLVTFAAILSALAHDRGVARDSAHPFGVAAKRYSSASWLAAGLFFAVLFLHNIDPALIRIAPRMIIGVIAVPAALAIAILLTWKLLPRSSAEAPTLTAAVPGSPGFLLRAVQAGVWLAALFLINALVILPLRASIACRDGDRLVADNLERAVAAYQQATCLCPDDDFYHAKLGAALRDNVARAATPDERQRLVELGRDAFARAAALVPNNAYYHLGVGRLWMEACRLHRAPPAQAFAEYDLALTLDENNAIYYADAASAALILEDFARARSYAERGCARYPNFGMLRAQVGYAAYMEHHLDEAIVLLTEALHENWYREENGRHFAEMMLAKLRSQGSGVRGQ
jgi:O-antigen ligase/tetratricopeptide (TPR) repeat protein